MPKQHTPQTYPPSGYRAQTLLKDSLTKGRSGAEAMAAAIANDPALSKQIGQLLDASRRAETVADQLASGEWWNALRMGASAYPPLVLVLGLVEGGVQLATYLYAELPEIKNAVGGALQSMFDAIVDFGDAASQDISDAWDVATESLGEVWDEAGEMWDAASDQAEAAWLATAEGIEDVGEGIREGVTESGVGEFLEGIGDWAQNTALAIERWWADEDETEASGAAGGETVPVSNPDEPQETYSEADYEEYVAEASSENRFGDEEWDETSDDWGAEDDWDPDDWEDDSCESDDWGDEGFESDDSWEPDLTEQEQVEMEEEGWI